METRKTRILRTLQALRMAIQAQLEGLQAAESEDNPGELMDWARAIAVDAQSAVTLAEELHERAGNR